MRHGSSDELTRRFDDKRGQWWTVTWRGADAASGRAAGYVFRATENEEEELFLEAGPGAGPDRLAQMSLGDVRQILSVARSGLV